MMDNEWKAPKSYKVNSEAEMSDLANDEKIDSVIDPLDYIIDDLFELNYPDCQDDESVKKQFRDQVVEQGYAYGRWFHYPWNNSLVRFPESDDLYELRTFRNRDLITKNEQDTLRNKKIAIFGLSVGSNVIDNTARSGIGNSYLLFDFDRLSSTNLNRIYASMGHVGLLKTTVTGRKIAELDPYISQQHFINGYDGNTDGILRVEKPDVIIDEVDNLKVKARLRNIASELGVPIVMAGDSDDVLVLDIERYDQRKTRPFNGKLSQKEVDSLINDEMSTDVYESTLIKLLGLKNLSTRLVKSGMLRGVELTGFPQLGTTSAIGGAMASVAIRDILLGRKIDSGTRVQNIRKSIESGRPTTIIEDINIIKSFVKYRRDQRRSSRK
jgi:molybdopterin/thiamine biosynthesis adenylyltransferase